MINVHHFLSAVFILTVLVPFNSSAQDENPADRHINTDGFFNPSAPDVWAMIKYGDINGINPYTGSMGLSIPFYIYNDEDFNIPVSISYSSSGYKPNIQTGVIGLGWFLNAGGAITRQTRGILDEEGETISDLYQFKGKNAGKVENDANLYTPTILGYGSLFMAGKPGSGADSVNITRDYFPDYAFYGKAGAEYFPMWSWNDLSYYDSEGHLLPGVTEVPKKPSFEMQPDVFNFNFMGRSGSFILQPAGKIIVFRTEDSPRNYVITVNLTRNGFESFEIITEDHFTYRFALPEKAKSYNEEEDRDDITSVNTWRLTEIEAPNGRKAVFSYVYPNTSSATYDPSYAYDYSKHWPRAVSESGEDNYTNTYESYGSYINEAEAECLSSIVVEGRASIEFTYSSKSLEVGNSVSQNPKKLDKIELKDASGNTVKTAFLSYRLNGQPAESKYDSNTGGITFLDNVVIPGEGCWKMDYRNISLAFPSQNTHKTDWYGYYNSNLPERPIFPPISILESGDNSCLNTLKQSDSTSTMYGMLTRVTWPTGGRSDIVYEQNRYGLDKAGVAGMPATGPTGGLRVKSVTVRDIDGRMTSRKTFSYIKENGTESGQLLWRPMIFSSYSAVSTGYKSIVRKTIGTTDNFPYSRNTHIEYPRVIEESIVDTSGIRRSLIEHKYMSCDMSECRDRITSEDSQISVGYWECITSPSIANSEGRYRIIGNLQSFMGGKSISETVYSDDTGHPVEKTEHSYGYFDPSGMERMSSYDMQFSYLFNYDQYFTTPYMSGSYKTAYDTSGHEITRIGTISSLDTDFRLKSKVSLESGGDTLRIEYRYLPQMPSRLISKNTYRNGRLAEGLKYSYTQSSSHSGLWLPSILEIAENGGIEGSSPTYHTEMTWDSFTDSGLPLQVTDKAGMATCLLWGWNGMHAAMKLENRGIGWFNSTFAGLSPIFTAGIPNYVENAARALSGTKVTTWEYLPLVGISGIKDPSGRKTVYEYDDAARLVRILDGDGNALKSFSYRIKTDDE